MEKINMANEMQRNPGIPYDPSWFQDIKINFPGVKLRAETIGKRRSIKKEWQAAWLLRAVSCMDLTTLSGKFYVRVESTFYIQSETTKQTVSFSTG